MTETMPKQRGWTPEVYARICEIIEQTPADDRLAVFDFDNTCVHGDIGELFGHYLVETMGYRYDLEAFWDLIHPEDGRDRLRHLVDQTLELDPQQRQDSQAYREYLAEMAGLYGRRLQRVGKRDCYQWAVRLHVGLSEEQMNRWSAEAIERELKKEQCVDEFVTSRSRRVSVQRGVRPFPQIRELIDVLHNHDWDVWIVSASNEWTIRQFAPRFGVDPSRVLGNRVAVEDGVLTAELHEPALYREGKVAAIQREIGKCPAMVFGDAVTDYEMLCEASRLAVVIDRGDEMLTREGRKRGWAFQPQAKMQVE